MIGALMRDTVLVERAPLTQGPRMERDWGMARSHEVGRCSIQPGGTSSDTDERRAYSESATLFAQPGADIEPGDRVTFGNATYEVTGMPMDMRSPSGGCSHVRCELKRWSS